MSSVMVECRVRASSAMDLLYDVAGSDRALLNHPPDGIPGPGCEPSYWMCFGLWKEGITTFPEACQALATHIGLLARLTPEDRVLEVGCGAGDSLRVWLQHFNVQHVTGIEVVRTQQELAAQRLQSWLSQQPQKCDSKETQEDIQRKSRNAAPVADKSEIASKMHAHVTHGSATQLSIEPDTTDAILAVDCAYHFNTRQQFFKEAARVLKLKGRLVMMDAVWDPGRLKSCFCRWLFKLFAKLFLVPASNHGDQTNLVCQLQSAGFVDIHIRDITELVVPGFVAFVRRQGVNNRDLRARYSPDAQKGAPAEQFGTDNVNSYVYWNNHEHTDPEQGRTASKQHPLKRIYAEVALYLRWQKFATVASILELLTCKWKCVQYVEVVARKPPSHALTIHDEGTTQ